LSEGLIYHFKIQKLSLYLKKLLVTLFNYILDDRSQAVCHDTEMEFREAVRITLKS